MAGPSDELRSHRPGMELSAFRRTVRQAVEALRHGLRPERRPVPVQVGKAAGPAGPAGRGSSGGGGRGRVRDGPVRLGETGAMVRSAGRTFGSALSAHRTELFFTNDEGVYVVHLQGAAANRMREVESDADRSRVVALYHQNRKKLKDGRLDIPRRVPPLFAHNFWDSNRPWLHPVHAGV